MNTNQNRLQIQKNLEIFLSESYNLDERLKSANDLCEILDSSCNESDIHILMNEVFERIKYFLEMTDVQHVQEFPLQQLRKACLDVIQKMPNVDVFRPYASAVLSLLFKLVEYENEENALLCVKLIIDLHKFYRPTLSGDVTGFLNFVRKVYRELKNQMDKIFEPHSNLEVKQIEDLDIQNIVLTTFTVTTVRTKALNTDGNALNYHILPKSCFSLKVMQEIPILVVLMYQLFKTNIHKDVSEFIPLIMEFINLCPPEEARLSPLFNNDIFIDFLAAQVKTLSFLAYVVKIFQDLIEKYSFNLVQGMMNLLVNCPPKVTNMRKEFFIATRHILSVPEIRPKFVDVLDLLMDEDVLIGQGFTVRDSLRPLAYSTLADLTHHIRNDLTLMKIASAVDLYGRNLFDETLPFSIRQMSLKLLLNLVDCIRQRAVNYQHQTNGSMQPFQLSSSTGNDLSARFNDEIQKGVARKLLVQTLAICIESCNFLLKTYFPQIEENSLPDELMTSSSNKASEEKEQVYKCIPSVFTASCIGPMGGKPSCNLDQPPTPILSTPNQTGCTTKQEIPTPLEGLVHYQLGFSDVRSLVKSLITGVKTVVSSLIQCPHPPNVMGCKSDDSEVNQIPPNHLSEGETHLLSLYFEYSLKLVEIIQIVPRDGYLFKRSVNSNIKHPDERHLLETLAMTFSQLSNVSFREIFERKIGLFVESCHKSSLCTTMVYHFLNNTNQTSNFGHVFLSYLVKRLHLLGEGNEISSVLMLLFKFCFNAVNMTATENEYVIKLYILKIVQGSMHLCLTAKEPTAYLTLLRTLFRSIGGGSHDKLYREFFPLLPEMLTTLNRLLRSPHRSHARDLLGELCVIVPVRLSTLMPYLNLLMEPLVYVINCNTVNQGLRTLELCVDNMPPEFLYEHLNRVRIDLLHSLKNALYSPIDNVQKTTFKVIGKLGCYNRCDIQEMQILHLDVAKGESGGFLILRLAEFPDRPLKIYTNQFIESAFDCIVDHSCDHMVKIRCWNLLYSLTVLNLKNSIKKIASHLDVKTSSILDLIHSQRFKDIIKAMFHEKNISCRRVCSEVQDLETVNLIKSLAGLAIIRTDGKNQQTSEEYEQKLNQLTEFIAVFGFVEEVVYFDNGKKSRDHVLLSHCFISGLLTVIGNEQKDVSNFAMNSLIKYIRTQISLLLNLSVEFGITNNSADKKIPSSTIVGKLIIFSHLMESIKNMLSHPAWYVKWGGCMVMFILEKAFLNEPEHLSIIREWFRVNATKLISPLLNCFHELSSQMGQATPRLVTQCLCLLIQRSFKQDLAKISSSVINFTNELAKGLISYENTPEVRKHSRFLLRYLSAWINVPLCEIIKPSCEEMLSKRFWLPKYRSDINFHLESLPALTQHCILELMNFLQSKSIDFPQDFLCDPIEQRYEPQDTWDYKTFSLIDYDEGGCGLISFDDSRESDAEFIASCRSIILSNNFNIRNLNLDQNANQHSLKYDSVTMQIKVKFLAIKLLSGTAALNDQKTFVCLFKGLSSAYEDIQDESITAITQYVSELNARHLSIQPRILKYSLKKVFDQFWHTESTLNLQTAKNIVCLLKLFPNSINETFASKLMHHLKLLQEDLFNETSSMLSMRQNSLPATSTSASAGNNSKLRSQYQSNLTTSPSTGQRDGQTSPLLMTSITQSIKIRSVIKCLFEVFTIIPEQLESCLEDVFIWLLDSISDSSQFINQGMNWLLDLFPFIATYFSFWSDRVFSFIYAHVSRDTVAMDIFMEIVKHKNAQKLLDYVIENMEERLVNDMEDFLAQTEETITTEHYRRHFFTIQLIHRIFNHQGLEEFSRDEDSAKFTNLIWPEKWIILNKLLKRYWISDRFYQTFSSLIDTQSLQISPTSQKMDAVSIRQSLWNLCNIMMINIMALAVHNPLDVSLHIHIIGGIYRLRCIVNMTIVRQFTLYLVNKTQPEASPHDYQWHRDLMSEYHSIFMESSRNNFNHLDYFQTPDFFSKVLNHLILPALQVGLERGIKSYILGNLRGSLDDQNSTDIVGLFIYHWLNDATAKSHTGLRVMHYRLAIILSNLAQEYIHDSGNKRQSTRLRTLTTFAWPSISSNLSVVDLQEKYYGLQLMVILIKKFNIGRSIIYQVFQCLVKGMHTETKKIVNPTLDALIPAWLHRPDDQRSLAYAIKKIMIEDHGTQSSIHILNLILRNYEVFSPIKNQLLPWIICTSCRIANQQNQIQIEYKRMILDLLDICVNWNLKNSERDKSSQDAAQRQSQNQSEKTQRDQIANLIIKFACQTIDSNTNGQGTAEQIAKKAITQIEYLFTTEVWGKYDLDLRFSFVNKILNPDDSSQHNIASVSVGNNATANSVAAATAASQSSSNAAAKNQSGYAASGTNPLSPSVLMTLDVIKTIVVHGSSQCILMNTKQISGSLCNLLVREFSNIRMIRCFALLMQAYLNRFPAETSNRPKISSHPELVEFYNCILKSIQESIQQFIEASSKSANFMKLQSSFILLSMTQQVTTNQYAFVDRCLVQLTKLIRRLITDMMNNNSQSSGTSNSGTANTASNSSSQNDIENTGTLTQSIDILISTLEIVKVRLSIVNNEIRKNAFGPDLSHIIDFTKEPRLIKVVIQIIRDWINISKSEEQFVPTVKEKIFLFDKLWLAFKRWQDNNEVSREILECIYQVFLSNCPRNQELMTRLKQAFCCSLLSQLPDVREKFLKYFLERSNILSFDEGTDLIVRNDPKPSTLFFRILFLLLSNSWDDQHFKDLFWLPLFIDVILIPVDEDKLPELVTKANIDDYPEKTGEDEKAFKKEELSLSVKSNYLKNLFSRCTNVEKSFDQNLSSSQMYQSLSCLYHKRPALATNLFSHIWPQLYNDFLFTNPEIKLDENSEESLTTDEMRHILVPELVKFLSNDQHLSVNNENMIVSLGSIFNAFITAGDSFTKKISFPLITYIGEYYNQWYNAILFTEKAISQRSKSDDQMILFNAPEMSLITLLEDIDDFDYLKGAWNFYSNLIDEDAFVAKRKLFSIIHNVWHARQTGQLTKSLNYVGEALTLSSEIDDKKVVESGSPLIYMSFLKTKYQKYSIDLMKKLGQWEKLDNLANTCANLFTSKNKSSSFYTTGLGGNSATSQTSIHSSSSLPLNQHHQQHQQQQAAAAMAAAGLSVSNCTPMPSMLIEAKADCAWRNSDWNELYLALAGLGNECTMKEYWKYALMLTSACVAGRRSCYFQQFNDTSNYTSVSSSITNNVLNMIKQSEAEGGRLLQTIFKEWHRLPFIISQQHVPILQACHRTIEVNEGNLVLAQCCGYYLSMTAAANSATSNVSNQPTTSTSSCQGTASANQPSSSAGIANSGSNSSAITSNYRFPCSQGSHDYKTIFKTWQNRVPLVQDDLSFWNDILDWRQVVAETIINCNTHSTKSQERANLVAICQRELGINQLQLAKGARKHGLTSVASQHLQRYTASNLPNTFEKVKQEIKIRLAENKKEDLLEGLELMEKTDIRTFDKKDRAKFFCYKAVFFSNFNKGDEATKNFGYATQMQDNMHKLWSVYGDFLENVYTSYPPQKRELAVSTTGVFAMQALMEAVSVAGINEKKARADLSKCLWLLTLDDASVSASSMKNQPTASIAAPRPSTSPQQKLAKMFEERVTRLSPEALLPWLSSFALSLLRPEGKYTLIVLKHISTVYPSAVYSHLSMLREKLKEEIQTYSKDLQSVQTVSNVPDEELANHEVYVMESTKGSDQDNDKLPSKSSTSKKINIELRETETKRQKTSFDIDFFGKEYAHEYETVDEVVSDKETEDYFNKDLFNSEDAPCPTDPLDFTDRLKKKDTKTFILKMNESLLQKVKMPTSIIQAYYRISYILSFIQKDYSDRVYIHNRFTNNVCARLIPSPVFQLHSRLTEYLNYLEDFIYTLANKSNKADLAGVTLPEWLFKLLEEVLSLKYYTKESAFDREASSTMKALSQADPLLNQIKAKLCEELKEASPRVTLYQTIRMISDSWLPSIENHIEVNEMKNFYLYERNINHFSELCSLTSISSPNHPYPKPSISYLALPGEWNYINQKSAPQANHFSQLNVLDILPVARLLKHSSSSRGNSTYSTLVSLRGSNGRIHVYSITCGRLTSLRNEEDVFYEAQREYRPIHLSQILNDILCKEAQTSKRKLNLQIPRLVELNTSGVMIREVGISSMTSSVAFAASSGTLPLPSHITTEGLTRVNQPPAMNQPSVPPDSLSIAHQIMENSLGKRNFEETTKFHLTSSSCITSSANNSAMSGGSTVVLLEARGRPCSQDNCVFLANESLYSIFDNAASLRKQKSDLIESIVGSSQDVKAATINAIRKNQKDLPRRSKLASEAIKTLKVVLGDGEEKWSYPLFTNWVMNRLEDCENYVLFRKSMAEQFASWFLIMQILHPATTWDPQSLIIDPRQGLIHLANLKFTLNSIVASSSSVSQNYHSILASNFGYDTKDDSNLDLFTSDKLYKTIDEKTVSFGSLGQEKSPLVKFRMSPYINEFLNRPLDYNILPTIMENIVNAFINRKHNLTVFQRTIYRDDLILLHRSRQCAIANVDRADGVKDPLTIPDLPNDRLVQMILTLTESSSSNLKKLSSYSGLLDAEGNVAKSQENFTSLIKASMDLNKFIPHVMPSRIPWI